MSLVCKVSLHDYLIALQQEIRDKTLASLVQIQDENIEQALNDAEDVINVGYLHAISYLHKKLLNLSLDLQFVDGCSRNAGEIADEFHELMVDVQGFQVKMNAFGREYLAQLNRRRQADWSMIENRKQQVLQLNSQIGRYLLLITNHLSRLNRFFVSLQNIVRHDL